ncbi:MAG: glycosyltransferase [Myxococcota bacterium]
MASTILVVPCYNEARRLPVENFESFAKGHPEVRFLMMNDGSEDETLEVLRRMEDRNEAQFTAIDLQPNRGKAEAVRRGLLAAFKEEARYAGFWDADLATPLETLPEFIRLLDSRPDLEMVLGARVKLLGRSIERSALRHYLGRVFATAASLALGMAVYDTQCGAKLFRITPATVELFREPFLTRWLFDVEILARLIRARRGSERRQPEDVVYELPLPTWRDVPGSKVRALDFPLAILQTLRIRRRYLSR